MTAAEFWSNLPLAIILAAVVFSPRAFRWFKAKRLRAKLDPDGHRALGLLGLAQKESKRLYETGLSHLDVTGNARKKRQNFTIYFTRDGTFVRGTIHINTNSQGAPGEREHFKQVEIARDKTLYVNDGKGWTTSPFQRTQTKMFGNAADPAILSERLLRASDIQAIGRRTVEGIECNAFSYSVPPERVDLKKDLGPIMPHFDAKATLICDRCDGQFAVGAEDLVIHQDVQFLAAHAKDEPNDWCDIKRIFTVRALDDQSITIDLPADIPESAGK
jgi:hypothetical protein